MTDHDAHARCQCGHSRQKHLYRGACRGTQTTGRGGAFPLSYSCTCYRFVLRPPVWRVHRPGRDWHRIVADMLSPTPPWVVEDPDGNIVARCDDQPAASRIAQALADAEHNNVLRRAVMQSGRHPAGRGLTNREHYDRTRKYYDNLADLAEPVATTRARLRSVLTDAEPTWFPMHTVGRIPPPDLGPVETVSGGSMHYVTADDEATIADKAEHYRER